MSRDGQPTPSWRRHFGPGTGTWFERTFERPTPAQIATWEALSAPPHHALVVAPTGSGKTLAAFLMSLDQLSSTPRSGKVRVLYVSPLKALAADIERNLRVPLEGIRQVCGELGLPVPDVRVAVRTGDTSPADRRSLIAHPPDILITTPESLFLMLSSGARQTLDGLQTVIVDEIHSLAGTKRGAHLAISLERLDDLGAPVRRIGLSATARPANRIAAFLGGRNEVTVIAPPSPKQWTLDVRVPVPDMANPGPAPGATADEAPNHSMWPHIEEAVLDLVLTHRSTICFVNSRMVAERLTAHLNQRQAARSGLGGANAGAMPNVYAATHGVAQDYDDDPAAGPVIARAHHGSLSKERRAVIEEDLKAGRLRCVVATSSLELGIDMGFVDLVILTGSPPSVASGLQRVGRAGHQVGVTSHGVVFPTSRTDLLEAAVVVGRMAAGEIEAVPQLRNPLDVLAQQVVSMCLDASPTAQAVYDTVRRAQPFEALPRTAFDAVIDMLAGRYPSEDFAELRPRLVWNRATDELTARPGSRQLVTTSGGTIPDRGLYGVFLVGEDDPGRGARRVGELDEEMVHESRVGDIITLGSSSWRVEAITPHQVQVTPAPGTPGRLPFWHGESVGRPPELGAAIGTFVALAAEAPDRAAVTLAADGLDEAASHNLLAYITEQKRATGAVPTDRTVVFERFRDEMGDWRVCIHAPFGLPVLRPWMLAVQTELTRRYGVDARITVRNDGIIWRLPAADGPPPGADLLAVPAAAIDEAVTTALAGSALFAGRFRECAARALLLPRRRPSTRTPLWAQRLRAGQLLEVAAGYRNFPIVIEAMRECLDDVFDMGYLRTLLADIAAGTTRLVEVETATPSPFARSLLFGYVGEFVYDADRPLAERRNAQLDIDPGLLTSLLGGQAQPSLDPAAAADVEADLQRLRHPAVSAEALWDVLRMIGPLVDEECEARCDGECGVWLADLAAAGRIARVEVGGKLAWAVTDDVALVASAETADRLRLAVRWLRCHVVTTPAALDARYRWGGQCEQLLDSLATTGEALVGPYLGEEARQYVAPEVLARVKHRAVTRLRASIEPVTAEHLAGFLAGWHGITAPERGMDALLGAVEQLAGWPLPVAALETLILPARVDGYEPGLLDEALISGRVLWSGAGTAGMVKLWPADLVLTGPADDTWLDGDPEAAALWERLQPGGAWRVGDLGPDRNAVQAALWRLAWAGLVTCDGFAPVRDARTLPVAPQPRRVRPWRPSAPYVAALAVRWSAISPTPTSPTARVMGAVTLATGRHGIVTRGALNAESMEFGTAYKVLAAMEDRGQVTRGYFVRGAGAAQFALPGVVDRLRADPGDAAWLLAATDPANPYGSAVPWPESTAAPARRAGTIVLLAAGRPICHLERGSRSCATFRHADDEALVAALGALGAAIDAGRLGPVALSRIDGQPVFDQRWAKLLARCGFQPTPQGFTRRQA